MLVLFLDHLLHPTTANRAVHVRATLQVVGSGFDSSADPLCRFHVPGNATVVAVSVLVVAQWHSAFRVDCVAPASNAQHSFIELSWNAQQFTMNHASFRYVPSAVVLHLVPLRVPAAGGIEKP